uniref:Uncharacterized protein n=1 Tax=Chromera velia CCMP2878 TaxID=1169474 RepID=A0A0G4HLQ2_9ALVE|eukprot:Cvel_28887.t1-p1 / transcript=Cvel_28887.t1 / gene=Cvel_28887 / organism=Chromera_velia_CCMP2878 / gene_product=hypothetical protein / transcript_product=hypothetical protein / location=Cvel_scaffold3863:4298-6370(-) / protein_length=691 / sequence_SO=supercontig / SO=protein_coding / is_pseudo=false
MEERWLVNIPMLLRSLQWMYTSVPRPKAQGEYPIRVLLDGATDECRVVSGATLQIEPKDGAIEVPDPLKRILLRQLKPYTLKTTDGQPPTSVPSVVWRRALRKKGYPQSAPLAVYPTSHWLPSVEDREFAIVQPAKDGTGDSEQLIGFFGGKNNLLHLPMGRGDQYLFNVERVLALAQENEEAQAIMTRLLKISFCSLPNNLLKFLLENEGPNASDPSRLPFHPPDKSWIFSRIHLFHLERFDEYHSAAREEMRERGDMNPDEDQTKRMADEALDSVLPERLHIPCSARSLIDENRRLQAFPYIDYNPSNPAIAPPSGLVGWKGIDPRPTAHVILKKLDRPEFFRLWKATRKSGAKIPEKWEDLFISEEKHMREPHNSILALRYDTFKPLLNPMYASADACNICEVQQLDPRACLGHNSYNCLTSNGLTSCCGHRPGLQYSRKDGTFFLCICELDPTCTSCLCPGGAKFREIRDKPLHGELRPLLEWFVRKRFKLELNEWDKLPFSLATVFRQIFVHVFSVAQNLTEAQQEDRPPNLGSKLYKASLLRVELPAQRWHGVQKAEPSLSLTKNQKHKIAVRQRLTESFIRDLSPSIRLSLSDLYVPTGVHSDDVRAAAPPRPGVADTRLQSVPEEPAVPSNFKEESEIGHNFLLLEALYQGKWERLTEGQMALTHWQSTGSQVLSARALIDLI